MSDIHEYITKQPSPIQEQWMPLEIAVREVVAFERRFGLKHLLLACHAALPLTFTPELLNLIHLNFLDRENIPWFAEADFLLSHLCCQLDTSLYEVEPRIREVLLWELEERFGHTRLLEIANFLLAYMDNKQPWQFSSWITFTQRWIALSYLAPDEAIKEMTDFLKECLSVENNKTIGLPGQILITNTLEFVADPLERTSLKQKYNYLLNDSWVLAEIFYGDRESLKHKLKLQEEVSGKLNEQVITFLSPTMQKWLMHTKESLNLLVTESTEAVKDQKMEEIVQKFSTQDAEFEQADIDKQGEIEDILKLTQELQEQDRIMDGDLQTLGLQSILKMLALSGKTGTLFVQSGPESLSISLRKGQIMALHEESYIKSDLLSMLCLINKLDPPRAHAVREASQGNLQVALAMLVERNWMSAEEMQHRLEFAVTQSISHALRWVDGRFSFHRQLVTMESRMRPLDIDSVLLEALRQADEWEEMGETSLTRMTVARWLPEVSNDIRSLGLSQEHIEVLCLANGEVPLQSMAMVLMIPEARVVRIMNHLLGLHLIEVVDTPLEAELQQDLSNIIIMCQHSLAQKRQNLNPKQHLLGLIETLSQCINGLLIHHGTYAKSLRGRNQLPFTEIVRYLERRFAQPLQLIAKQQYPILEIVTFTNGQLDCTEIMYLDKLVRGEKLEEFYWEAVLGLATFLRTVFSTLLQDEVGNSHTGRQLNYVWKAFLTEVDQEIQQYQLYRAHQNTQQMRNRYSETAYQIGAGRSSVPQGDGNLYWSPETQRRSI